MNGLQQLKTFLENTGATGVNQVLFDLNQIINTETNKDYPLVFWDLSSVNFTDNWKRVKRNLTIKVYIVGRFVREEEFQPDKKISLWDDLENTFKAYIDYLDSIRNSYAFTFVGLDAVKGTYYDRGMISVDEEVGVGYQLEIESYC